MTGAPRMVELAGREVGRIGLGCLEVGGPFGQGPPDRDGAVALLRRAADAGVGLFDTADSYGPGASEELLAEALWPYEDVVVATKGGMVRPGPGEWIADARPAQLRHACEGSLQRLRVEAIDLYLLHQVDPAVPVEESVGALVELRDEGKIRHIGVCNVDVGLAARAVAVSGLAAVQNRYGVAHRDLAAVSRWCAARGVPYLAFGPFWDLDGPVLAALERVAAARAATPHQVALAWLLAQGDHVLPLPGTAVAAHLDENVAAADLVLTAGELAELG